MKKGRILVSETLSVPEMGRWLESMYSKFLYSKVTYFETILCVWFQVFNHKVASLPDLWRLLALLQNKSISYIFSYSGFLVLGHIALNARNKKRNKSTLKLQNTWKVRKQKRECSECLSSYWEVCVLTSALSIRPKHVYWVSWIITYYKQQIRGWEPW